MSKPRRSRTLLERAVSTARGRSGKARAQYALALFHDNNSREGEAILHYRQAIAFGLPGPTKAQALAWLASSLYKTSSPHEAHATLQKAQRLTSDPELRDFLASLERRIDRSL